MGGHGGAEGVRIGMAAFQELDYSMTPLGALILRRREVLSLDRAEVFEVKLDGNFLMSSVVNQAEIALATRALRLVNQSACEVLIGGLGLGYTAQAALQAPNVASVTVMEYLDRVIDWYRRGLVPLADVLTRDPRCMLVHGDFFAAVGSPADGPADHNPISQALGARRFHAILLDIDHSPQCLLQPSHADFYTPAGLKRLTEHLHPGGVFALWSADPPDDALLEGLRASFPSVQASKASFYNPLLNEQDVNCIYIAQRGDLPGTAQAPTAVLKRG